MARLHVICGNCGCNDEWTFEYHERGFDHGDHFTPDAYMCCGNCATQHSLSDNLKEPISPTETGE